MVTAAHILGSFRVYVRGYHTRATHYIYVLVRSWLVPFPLHTVLITVLLPTTTRLRFPLRRGSFTVYVFCPFAFAVACVVTHTRLRFVVAIYWFTLPGCWVTVPAVHCWFTTRSAVRGCCAVLHGSSCYVTGSWLPPPHYGYTVTTTHLLVLPAFLGCLVVTQFTHCLAVVLVHTRLQFTHRTILRSIRLWIAVLHTPAFIPHAILLHYILAALLFLVYHLVPFWLHTATCIYSLVLGFACLHLCLVPF